MEFSVNVAGKTYNMMPLTGKLAGYSVSEDGQIYSLAKNRFIHSTGDGAYKRVCIGNYTWLVRRLIAMAFHTPPSSDHIRATLIDPEKKLTKDNIQWSTVAASIGKTVPHGEDFVRNVKKCFVECEGIISVRTKQCSLQFGISYSTARTIIRGVGHYEKYRHIHPYPFDINDLVGVAKKDLASYGQVGTVVDYDLDRRSVRVDFGENRIFTYNHKSLIKVKKK